MPTFKLANIAALIVTLSASMLMSSAQAAPIVFTTTGTIDSGYDSTGVFGTAGDLAGKSYMLSFAIDPALYAYSNQYGGVKYTNGPSTGSLTETVTVNGVTRSFALNLSQYNWGQTYTETSASFNEIYQYQTGTTTAGDSIYSYSYVYDYFNNPALALAATLATMSYQVTNGDYGYANFSLNNGNSAYFYANAVKTLSIRAANDVPEPAPLALLGLGLVALAVSGRKSRA